MYTFEDIIGNSEEILKLKNMAKKAANSDAPVLIYGDTGTGKELLVQAIHSFSKRRNYPFIAQNCAAIPSNLSESMFFGTGRGGYTGAVDFKGLFESSGSGTLYLDELNSMSTDFQGKLLRVIQEGEYRRVGEVEVRKSKCRIIASVNESPEDLVAKGTLRKDLYYRINVIRLDVPKLDSRREDIPVLIQYFIKKYNQRLGGTVSGVSEDAYRELVTKEYDGNIRELEHIIEQAINYKKQGVLGLADLGLTASKVDYNMGLRERLLAEEKRYIEEALILCNYNITRASEMLKIPRQTLQYKMNKYNIKKPFIL